MVIVTKSSTLGVAAVLDPPLSTAVGKLCINLTETHFIPFGNIPLFLSLESFEKITFPYLEYNKHEKGYQSERYSLVIMDAFTA